MADFRGSSPTSDIFSDEIDSISIRDKALLKRSVSKHHNNNFKAGYVPVHEQHLNKTGLRGRKTFAFWTLVALLFILAVGNLVLTVTILGVLRLGQGMESIELVPEEYAVKFFGDTDLGHMYKRDGRIEGFKDEPVEISADESAVLLNLSLRNGRPMNKLRINQNGTHFRGFELFTVKNRQGTVIFSTGTPHFHSLTGATSLEAKTVETDRIVSPVNSNLKIEGRTLTLKGSEGTTMDGKKIFWSADQDIYLKTENDNGSIVLNGTLIDVRRIPIALLRHTHNSYITTQYKVCVCMPQGKLFRIPVPSGSNSRVYCNYINSQHNPCI
ncbi:Sarcoglycan 1 domain containing protein [Asbolus verrucosus]|uniref:Beta-sarcoglycan n=1 Tax=Asbolus verrucosus TaxID=1661398 RepID=A0A482VWV9_ASBVE|nr:Sarcoglycan 1 domain containing protein [Asbolus verrucosus]